MDYRRADDELFGKYCYIDTPWIAGEKTIYRIIRSGVRSNAWCEVPVRGRNEIVTHDRYEDIVFVVLDTLIDEDTKIKRFALKDIEIIEIADRKTENSSEIPNNCEHITEDGVTCAKYPACDDCLDNPLNKVKGSERLVKGSEQTEPTISKMEQVEPQTCSFSDCDNFKNPDYERCIKCKRKQIKLKTEPRTDCGTCRYGKDKRRYAHICNECGVGINNYTPKTETQTETQNSNLCFEKPQTDLVNDSQVLAKDLVDDEFNPYDEECMRCKHLKLKCEFVPSYCKYEPKDESQK